MTEPKASGMSISSPTISKIIQVLASPNCLRHLHATCYFRKERRKFAATTTNQHGCRQIFISAFATYGENTIALKPNSHQLKVLLCEKSLTTLNTEINHDKLSKLRDSEGDQIFSFSASTCITSRTWRSLRKKSSDNKLSKVLSDYNLKSFKELFLDMFLCVSVLKKAS